MAKTTNKNHQSIVLTQNINNTPIAIPLKHKIQMMKDKTEDATCGSCLVARYSIAEDGKTLDSRQWLPANDLRGPPLRCGGIRKYWTPDHSLGPSPGSTKLTTGRYGK